VKPLSEISTIRPCRKVHFNNCIDCGKLFTARTTRKIRCDICRTPTVQARKRNNLVKLKRTCMNPTCGKPFVTYNKNQFACSIKCSDIVTNIRRKYDIKLRKFLSICTSCGQDAFKYSLCDRCHDKQRKSQTKQREKNKKSGLCTCGNELMDGAKRCERCYLRKQKANMLRRHGSTGRKCLTDGCDNIPGYKKLLCETCVEDREAAKQICKVYFIKCKYCNTLFTTNSVIKKYCSDKCLREYYLFKPIARQCDICGSDYIFKVGKNFYNTCSQKCREESIRENKRNAKHKRRLLLRDGFIEKVSTIKLFYRDKGRCQICGRKLNLKREVPHPLAMTVDHIIPLSKGGEHSYRNTQLACFKCNTVKGNRPIQTGEQLLLFGNP